MTIGEIKLSAEQLHPEEGEDDDEQEEQEEQGYDGSHRVHEGANEIPQRHPVGCEFEDSEKSQSSKHGDTEGATPDFGPDDFDGGTNNNDAIETIKLRGEVGPVPHGEDFDQHLADEDAQEAVFGDFQNTF